MIRELAIFAARCAIALTLIGCGVNAVLAQRIELTCRPVFARAVRCDPGSLGYNRAPIECHRS